jgi:hypothetical protein
MRLRGLSGARDEFLMAAIAQNLRRYLAMPSRPDPSEVFEVSPTHPN